MSSLRNIFIGRSAAVALLTLFPLCLAAQEPPAGDWKRAGVIDLDRCLNARLHPVPVSAVRMPDGFWAARRKITTERSLPTMLALLEDHGVVDNFRRLSGKKNVPRRGPLYTDSDLYKWMEAAAWAIASNETSSVDKQKFRANIESLTTDIAAAQEASGYLQTYYVGDKTKLRFTELTRSHEDYDLGHLIQAGIAFYRATGDRKLLDIAIKSADYMVGQFGPGKRPFITGHPELEMALVELYRTTGQSSYLSFARYLFSGVERERLKLTDTQVRYMFSGSQFTDHKVFEGHAVRALYAASGATDYFAESGDPDFKTTLDRLWNDLTRRKMYVTGGAGSRSQGESFGDPYELPSAQAYAETCASIANVMWNFRLLSLSGDARYADVLERALYNGVNAGMSLSGNLYCYRNPLAADAGDKVRNPWYDTTCCPPNIQRLFESLPGYFYATGRDGVYVNLYNSSELNWHLEDGSPLKLAQTTAYPWSGDIQFTVQPEKSSDFTLHLRWPSWAPTADLQVNGVKVPVVGSRGSFIALTRTWNPGDTVKLSLAFAPVTVTANPLVTDLYDRIAIQRGPLVYALEQIDQSAGVLLSNLSMRPSSTAVGVEFRKDLLGGVTVLKFPALVTEKNLQDEPLYEVSGTQGTTAKRQVAVTLIPYFVWANREPSSMMIWIPAARNSDLSVSVPAVRTFTYRPEASR